MTRSEAQKKSDRAIQALRDSIDLEDLPEDPGPKSSDPPVVVKGVTSVLRAVQSWQQVVALLILAGAGIAVGRLLGWW